MLLLIECGVQDLPNLFPFLFQYSGGGEVTQTTSHVLLALEAKAYRKALEAQGSRWA